MRDDPVVIALVRHARDGDESAWDSIVDRYAPMVWAICRRFQLSQADAADVGQEVWLRLVEHLPILREPAALPGWIATTTRRECLRVARVNTRDLGTTSSAAPEAAAGDWELGVEQEVLTAERNAALRDAMARLPMRCQQLLTMLIVVPPVAYAEISTRMNIAIGSIGPSRSRCLDRLRHDPDLAAFLQRDTQASRMG